MLGRFALPHARGVRVPSYRRFPAPAAVPCPVLAGHFPLPHAPSAASVALPPALGLPRPGALRVSRPALCDSIRGSPVAARLIHAARHPPPPPHSRIHYPLPPAARFPVPLPTSSGLVPAEACYFGTLCLDLPHRRPPPAPHSASRLPALLRPALRSFPAFPGRPGHARPAEVWATRRLRPVPSASFAVRLPPSFDGPPSCSAGSRFHLPAACVFLVTAASPPRPRSLVPYLPATSRVHMPRRLRPWPFPRPPGFPTPALCVLPGRRCAIQSAVPPSRPA